MEPISFDWTNLGTTLYIPKRSEAFVFFVHQ